MFCVQFIWPVLDVWFTVLTHILSDEFHAEVGLAAKCSQRSLHTSKSCSKYLLWVFSAVSECRVPICGSIALCKMCLGISLFVKQLYASCLPRHCPCFLGFKGRAFWVSQHGSPSEELSQSCNTLTELSLLGLWLFVSRQEEIFQKAST